MGFIIFSFEFIYEETIQMVLLKLKSFYLNYFFMTAKLFLNQKALFLTRNNAFLSKQN